MPASTSLANSSGVPVSGGLGLPDAVSSLAGSVAGGDSGSTVVPTPPVVAVPTPTPRPSPTR